MVEKELIRRLKKIHPLFKPLMEMAADSYEGGRNEKYYLEFDDGIHHSLGTINIQNKHDEYERESVKKITRITFELFNMRTGKVIEVALSYVYQFNINLNGGISKRIPTDSNNDNDISTFYRNLTEDDINLLESKNQSNHHVYFYEKAESIEDDTDGDLDFLKNLFLIPFRFPKVAIFMMIITGILGGILSKSPLPVGIGKGVMIVILNFLVTPLTIYLAYKLIKMRELIMNKVYDYFIMFIGNLAEEMNTIILLSNEPTTPYRLHEFLDMTKTSDTGRYNKLIFNFGDKGHVIKRITPLDVSALSDTDYETKAIVDSCVAEPLTPQELKHIMSTIENVKKVKKEEKEQAKSQHYYNKYKPQVQSREGKPSVFEQTLSELEKDIRDDMEKHKDVMEKHKS